MSRHRYAVRQLLQHLQCLGHAPAARPWSTASWSRCNSACLRCIRTPDAPTLSLWCSLRDVVQAAAWPWQRRQWHHYRTGGTARQPAERAGAMATPSPRKHGTHSDGGLHQLQVHVLCKRMPHGLLQGGAKLPGNRPERVRGLLHVRAGMPSRGSARRALGAHWIVPLRQDKYGACHAMARSKG